MDINWQLLIASLNHYHHSGIVGVVMCVSLYDGYPDDGCSLLVACLAPAWMVVVLDTCTDSCLKGWYGDGNML